MNLLLVCLITVKLLFGIAIASNRNAGPWDNYNLALGQVVSNTFRYQGTLYQAVQNYNLKQNRIQNRAFDPQMTVLCSSYQDGQYIGKPTHSQIIVL
jgi:hypothetical protein